MMAILLGILVRNSIRLPELFNAGIRFGLERMLRIGIVLLGIRLSLGEVGAIGLKPLGAGLVSAVIVGGASVALISVLF